MSEAKKNNGLAFLENLTFVKKLKQFKHIGLIITIIFILILLLILFGNFNFISGTKTENKSSSSTYTTSGEFVDKMEAKLKNLLTRIQGAGNVEVMITLESGSNLVLSGDEDGKILTGGNQSAIVSTNSFLEQIGEDSSIVMQENLPKIKGVVVVASGAEKLSVKLSLMQAVQTLLDLSSDRIQIFIGN